MIGVALGAVLLAGVGRPVGDLLIEAAGIGLSLGIVIPLFSYLWEFARLGRAGIRDALAEIANRLQALEAAGKAAPGASSSTPRVVTGDTMFRDVWSLRDVDYMDYREGLGFLQNYFSHGSPFDDLNLGQIALLRRLAVAAESASRTMCESALRFAKCADPPDSFGRLLGHGLIQEEQVSGRFSLTREGRVVARGFTKILMHDPRLVAAYRQVTLGIDKGVRFDRGRPLSSTQALPEEWAQWLP